MKNPFPLHKQVLEEASDRELSDAISATFAEVKRRALLDSVYDRSVNTIVNTIGRNVKTIEARNTAMSSTPVLDSIRAKRAAGTQA